MKLILRASLILSVIASTIWVIHSPGRDTLVAFLASVVALLTFLVSEKSKKEIETLDQHNRRVMLNHVENFWVKGILEKSLYGAALLELGIKEDPTAINYPWTIKRESTNETLPAGKSMLEIFEEIGAGRSLLILGAPGSGKTTMLIELARQLIERARKDEIERVPVVFNLASWTEKQTLAVWLSEQLKIIYHVPKKTAPRWVSENKMLLLLDGLDEVKQDSRVKCVETINHFRDEHGFTSLVISSRIEEYTAINMKLSMEGAIKLQPLTSEQVNVYFDKFGNRLASVRQLLKRDKPLEELTETPLMLSIMTLAYTDKKPEDLPASINVDDQRKQLFTTYINRMFERPTRATKTSFTKPETLHYLNWLAQKMIRHNIITYQIEAMRSSWLEDDKQQSLFGLIVGQIDEIEMVDKISWSWKKAQSDLNMMLPVVLPLGLVFGLIAGGVVGLSAGLVVGLSAGLTVGLGVGLIFGLGVGLSPEQQIEETNYPGQRLKQTFYNAISIILIIELIGGLIGGLIGRLSGDLGFGLSLGLGSGLFIALIVGLDYGINALIQHYTLRNILIKNGLLPWTLIPFLEHAVDLIFLRRVGGSYIFIHRLLMEHFAEMEVEK